METITINENHLQWQFDDHILRIDAWGTNSLRIRATKASTIDLSQDWALLPSKSGDLSYDRFENGVTVTNGNISATVDLQGRVIYRNQHGARLLEELWRQRDVGEPFWSIGNLKQKSISALKIDGREIKPLSGDAFELTVRFESEPTEKLFGMGQYQPINGSRTSSLLG